MDLVDKKGLRGADTRKQSKILSSFAADLLKEAAWLKHN
jgi:hypothetical protein